jgi:large subunit ribosomal protein L29
MTDEELKQKEKELKQKLLSLRFQVVMGKQDNTAALPETRKDIARIKTILSERANKKRKKDKRWQKRKE